MFRCLGVCFKLSTAGMFLNYELVRFLSACCCCCSAHYPPDFTRVFGTPNNEQSCAYDGSDYLAAEWAYYTILYTRVYYITQVLYIYIYVNIHMCVCYYRDCLTHLHRRHFSCTIWLLREAKSWWRFFCCHYL